MSEQYNPLPENRRSPADDLVPSPEPKTPPEERANPCDFFVQRWLRNTKGVAVALRSWVSDRLASSPLSSQWLDDFRHLLHNKIRTIGSYLPSRSSILTFVKPPRPGYQKKHKPIIKYYQPQADDLEPRYLPSSFVAGDLVVVQVGYGSATPALPK